MSGILCRTRKTVRLELAFEQALKLLSNGLDPRSMALEVKSGPVESNPRIWLQVRRQFLRLTVNLESPAKLRRSQHRTEFCFEKKSLRDRDLNKHGSRYDDTQEKEARESCPDCFYMVSELLRKPPQM